MWGRYGLRFAALGYLAAILLIPVSAIFWRTFQHGVGPVWHAISTPDAVHAFKLTLVVALCAVVLNTVFGVLCALVLVRQEFPGKRLLDSVIDLPFAVSPVIVGLALVLIYSNNQPVGQWLESRGIQVIFATPGMVLATVFVCLPYVVREVIPVLREVGSDQEEAAHTLGASATATFWRITLPAIRWGVAYGVVLTTARALGEFGAVTVVSGHLAGQTDTLTLYVQERFESFDLAGAYAASFVLAAIALVVLLVMGTIGKRGGARTRPPVH